MNAGKQLTRVRS